MKKSNVVFIIIIAILSIMIIVVGYKYVLLKKEVNNFPGMFYATIEDIRENRILVVGLSVNDINYRGMYMLNITDDTMILWRGTKLNLEDLDVGDNISITYTDEIVNMVSPAPLYEVKFIQLLDDSIEMNKPGYDNEL